MDYNDRGLKVNKMVDYLNNRAREEYGQDEVKYAMKDWTTAVKEKSWDKIDMDETDYQYIPTGPRAVPDIVRYDTTVLLIDVLEELDRQGKLDFWLLKHPGIADFWAVHRKQQDAKKLYNDALERLKKEFTREELEALRIRLPSNK